MNRKGVLITVMMIQLVLLVLTSIMVVESERQVFTGKQEFNKLGSYKMASLSENLLYELDVIKNQNLTSASSADYFEFVNLTYKNYYNLNIIFEKDYLLMEDSTLKFYKELDI